MSDYLACPNCGRTDDLWSNEQATVAYPVRFPVDDDGPDYTGSASQVYDEATTFDDDVDCKSCGTYGMTWKQLVEKTS